MSIVKITDHAEQAQARLLSILQKPKMKALIAALTSEVQAFEDAFYDVLTKRLLDATGVTLDQTGSIVGQLREGDADDVYRRKIGARILANKSRGTTEDILGVLRAVLGLSPGTGSLIFSSPRTYHGVNITAYGQVIADTKSFVVRIMNTVISSDMGATLVSLLRRAKSASARGIIESAAFEEKRCFRFSPVGFTYAPITAGATFLPALRRDASGTFGYYGPGWGTVLPFPSSPFTVPVFAVIGDNGVSIDVVQLTGQTGAGFNCAAIPNNYATGTLVSFPDWRGGSARGFADTSDPGYEGGHFRDARQAPNIPA